MLLFLPLAQPLELQSGTYLQTGSVITHTHTDNGPPSLHFSPTDMSESVSQCVSVVGFFFFFFLVHLNKYGSLWWEARATVPLMVRGSGVEWRGCGRRGREGGGDYARLTHVNLSSVCFLRDRARTPPSVRLLRLIAFERES